MSLRHLLFWPLALTVVLGAARVADPQATPAFPVGATKVVLDVVVRDRKGSLVKDLRASDFEVYEDGVPQTVDSFDMVAREPEERLPPPEAAPTVAPEPPAVKAAPAVPTIIAFVFDQMSAPGRDMAHKAVLTYADKGHAEGDVAGVFAVEGGLRTVESFTTDLGLIRSAFDRALARGGAAGSLNARDKNRATLTSISRAENGVASAGAGSPSITLKAVSAAKTAANRMQIRMDRTWESFDRDAGGSSTVNALLAVVAGLSAMPGRKTVVFFSEGMALPPAVQAGFRSVIASANRANVSVYTMDAGGLRVESDTEETRREINQSAERRMAQLAGEAPESNRTRDLERNEDLLHLSPGSGLGQLAQDTGGMPIHDTNDASGAFHRIEEDMRSYYLLSYSPTNETYDGRFRSIAVKLRRPGLDVQARKGYFALKGWDASPVLAYEAPAVAALDQVPGPEAFPLGLAALSFPEPSRTGLVSIVVEVPQGVVAYRPGKEKKSARSADFAVVVRVRNKERQEVAKMSRHYSFPASEAKAGSTHDLVFYREADLEPGRYVVEAVGYDGVTGKASVRTTDLEVREVADGRPRLSSLVLVTHADSLAPEEKKNVKPLYFGDTVLYPGSGEGISKASASGLSFFFTVYGAGSAPCEARIEVRQGNRQLRSSTAILADPDAIGRIQYSGAVPLDSFAVGSYSLRVSLSDARGSDDRAVPFTVVE